MVAGLVVTRDEHGDRDAGENFACRLALSFGQPHVRCGALQFGRDLRGIEGEERFRGGVTIRARCFS